MSKLQITPSVEVQTEINRDTAEMQDKTSSKADEFIPVASQEELDRIINARIKRERNKYADYSALKEKAASLEELYECSKAELDTLQSRVKGIGVAAEQQKVAIQVEAQKHLASQELEISVRILLVPQSVGQGLK